MKNGVVEVECRPKRRSTAGDDVDEVRMSRRDTLREAGLMTGEGVSGERARTKEHDVRFQTSSTIQRRPLGWVEHLLSSSREQRLPP
jgi:hypothetical protein